jgi:hypothetical protein
MNPYFEHELNLGEDPSFSTGHEAYLKAIYEPTKARVIYKKNKFGDSKYSRLEVSFGQLAQLFLAPNLSSTHHLVVKEENNPNITGIAVEHLCYSIEKKEGLKKSFYPLKEDAKRSIDEGKKITDVTKIPIYFLDKLPQGYFAQLIKDEKNNKLTIDYKSLASVLTTSYTMEEDDLHKGNFGFYIVKKNKKPHVVFFKIDHDLMFVDSIMGFETRRILHLFHDFSAFDITEYDLLFFPNIKNSANFYWPTKFGYVSNPFNNKEYHNLEELKAFAHLAVNPEFVKAKWASFYKHILIPTELIHSTLGDCSDLKNESDRAHAALITQAMVSRLAALRAVLFSIKEFREFVVNLKDHEKKAIRREIVPKNHPLEKQIKDSLKHFEDLCSNPEGFEAKDSPMHTAIKLGEYRYHDTMRMFGKFINAKNDSGKTPLDLVVERAKKSNPNEDIRKDNQLIMQHLLDHGARTKRSNLTIQERAQLDQYRYPNPYLKKIHAKQSYLEFKEVLRDIGEDHHFCLKYKKNLALECINHWIQIRKNSSGFHQELTQLRKDMNQASPQTEHASIKYISQLRSKLWVVRQIRGLYGLTSTQFAINRQIDQEIEALKTKKPKKSSFFAAPKKEKSHSPKGKDGYQPVSGI